MPIPAFFLWGKVNVSFTSLLYPEILRKKRLSSQLNQIASPYPKYQWQVAAKVL